MKYPETEHSLSTFRVSDIHFNLEIDKFLQKTMVQKKSGNENAKIMPWKTEKER